MKEINMNDEVNGKIVIDSGVARHLIRIGYTIIDIKPNKHDKSHKRSVFVFKNEPGIEDDIFSIKSHLKNKNHSKNENL